MMESDDAGYGKTGLRRGIAELLQIGEYFRKSFLTKKNRFIKMSIRQAVKKISNSRSTLQRGTGWCEVPGGGNEPALESPWETMA